MTAVKAMMSAATMTAVVMAALLMVERRIF